MWATCYLDVRRRKIEGTGKGSFRILFVILFRKDLTGAHGTHSVSNSVDTDGESSRPSPDLWPT